MFSNEHISWLHSSNSVCDISYHCIFIIVYNVVAYDHLKSNACAHLKRLEYHHLEAGRGQWVVICSCLIRQLPSTLHWVSTSSENSTSALSPLVKSAELQDAFNSPKVHSAHIAQCHSLLAQSFFLKLMLTVKFVQPAAKENKALLWHQFQDTGEDKVGCFCPGRSSSISDSQKFWFAFEIWSQAVSCCMKMKEVYPPPPTSCQKGANS